MRIATVLTETNHGFGGIERAALRIASGAAERGHDVDALIQQTSREPARQSVAGPLTVVRFSAPAVRALPISLSLARYLLLRAREYDIVHVHNYHALLALAVAAVPGVSLVFSPHYHGRGRTALRTALHYPYRPLGQHIFDTAAAVLCASAAEADLCRAHFRLHADPLTIGHGVDTSAIAEATPFAGEEQLIFCVGRLEHYKRFDKVIEAVPYLGPEWRLVIAGTGPATRSLCELVHRLHIAKRVQLVGAITDAQKYRWLRTARVFVTLSSLEAFALTILEACAAGLSVVASDIPAHREHAQRSYGEPIALVAPDIAAQQLAMQIAGTTPNAVPQNRYAALLPTWEAAVNHTLNAYELAIMRQNRP